MTCVLMEDILDTAQHTTQAGNTIMGKMEVISVETQYNTFCNMLPYKHSSVSSIGGNNLCISSSEDILSLYPELLR